MSGAPVRDVAVLGLGQMGGGIARNLDKTGFLGAVWDPRPEIQKEFGGRNDVVVAAPAALPGRCKRFLFVVPTSKETGACLVNEGMLERMDRGSIVCDLTTSDPAESAKLAEMAAARGIAYLDCGMTGGATGADAGKLKLMIGGDKDAVEACRDMFAGFTDAIIHVGPSGSGHAMKLIHNMVLHTMFFANVEGVRAAARFGIDAQTVIDVFNSGNARSYISEFRFPRHILSGKWDARSKVSNLEKDLRMAIEMADRKDAPTPFGDLTTHLLGHALERGMKDTDFSRLYEVFEELVDK